MGPLAEMNGTRTATGEPSTRAMPTADELHRFRDYVQRHSGIFLEAERAEALRVSLLTRAARTECKTLDEYFGILTGDDAEFKELLNLITINETSFFRFPAQFEALARTVVPEVLACKPGPTGVLRVWSAGCSSGEEPYSIAMRLLDAGVVGLGFTPEVVGTDVSTEALDRARCGVYPARSLIGVPEGMRSRYFEKVEEGYRVTDVVRDVVELSYHNLVKEPYPIPLSGNFDVIFCRNVTIYFRLESTRRIMRRFFESLNPGGYLFVGHSETLASVSDEFEPVEIDGVFLYRKPNPPQAAGSGRSVVRRPLRAKRREEQQRDASPEHASPQPAAVERALETHLRIAHAHADAGDFVAAIASCRRALNVNPLSASARYILGVIYQRLDDPLRAAEEFKRAVCVNPDFVLAHFNLANLERGQRAYVEACAEYANALSALERSPEGEWTDFLDGFTSELLEQSCRRALVECEKVTSDG